MKEQKQKEKIGDNAWQVEEVVATISEAELREFTITQQVPTAIADAGATSNCGMDYESNCGRYCMGDPFHGTGKPSDKIFQYLGGDIAAATTIKQLPMEIQDPAKDVHIVPGINNNLISTSKFVNTNYVLVLPTTKYQYTTKTIWK